MTQRPTSKTPRRLLPLSLIAFATAALIFATAAWAATRPQTLIHYGPTGTVSSHRATFHVASSKPGYVQCKRDARAWYKCTTVASGFVTLRNLRCGSHTFRARGVDRGGRKDLTPAVRTWRIRC
jgi:hypothetical protein